MPQARPLFFRLLASGALIGLVLLVSSPAHAQSARAKINAQDIEMADYNGGDLPDGQSALTAKVQILLDRSGISPGVVDGFKGGMSQSAVAAFERGHGLPIDGRMDREIWGLLVAYADAPMTTDYTIVAADAEGLVDSIPTDYAEKAAMTSQGYTSVLERLAERFHMDEKFLAQLNPGAGFVPGETIRVTVPAKPIRAKVARIVIDKRTSRVAAYDANGRLVADYPATVGSTATPSPQGMHKVTAVALDPTYTYDPNKNFKQGENDRVLIVPPGPNAPVGNVWIDLSMPTYGIHGTPSPSRLFVSQSYGCVRLTNWDARELAHMVQPGSTEVEFLAEGISIVDATGPGATMASTRPPVRLAEAEGTTATDAAVAQAIATITAQDELQNDSSLLGAQRPGMNPLRRAATSETALPATPEAPLPTNIPTGVPGIAPRGVQPIPDLPTLPQSVQTDPREVFDLPPATANSPSTQPLGRGTPIIDPFASVPAAPRFRAPVTVPPALPAR